MVSSGRAGLQLSVDFGFFLSHDNRDTPTTAGIRRLLNRSKQDMS